MKKNEIAFRCVLILSSFAAACNSDDGNLGVNPSGAQSGGIVSINGDPTRTQQIVYSSKGTGPAIATKDGITIVQIPVAGEGVAAGLITKTDLQTLKSIEDRLGPTGDAVFETTRAVSRGGFFQGYADLNQPLASGADMSTSVQFTQNTRVDTAVYSHALDANIEQVTVQQAGDYRVSFNVTALSTTQDKAYWFRAWLENNGAEVVPSKATCSTSKKIECTIHSQFIVHLDQGAVLVLKAQGRQAAQWGTGVQATIPANGVWLTIERI